MYCIKFRDYFIGLNSRVFRQCPRNSFKCLSKLLNGILFKSRTCLKQKCAYYSILFKQRQESQFVHRKPYTSPYDVIDLLEMPIRLCCSYLRTLQNTLHPSDYKIQRQGSTFPRHFLLRYPFSMHPGHTGLLAVP